ncbi:hypothetical protein CKO15_05705 [Halorhodospira abdelmalekii]|uniref:holo-ACP synthase n=1 Tax=Halorhodospira abdelmalekii TaxID=421629 RepID=UPI001902C645|nr:hypothetical protein [Halorhodospira abdelmalekii]
MIVGIGTDIVAVARIGEAWQRHGERFAQRLLHPSEWAQLQQRHNAAPAAFLARRFAAKEAAAKALGTGLSEGITLRLLEVAHDRRGRPLLHLHGAAAQRAETLGVVQACLSISDERAYALAFVVLYGGPDRSDLPHRVDQRGDCPDDQKTGGPAGACGHPADDRAGQ